MANRSTAARRLRWPATALRTRWTSSGRACSKELGQLADLDLVARAAARGVDEDEVDGAELVERPRHLDRIVDDRQRQVDDLGISLELLDRRDPVGIDGDQPDPHAVSQLEIGRKLGDGRGLADARRSHQGHDPAGTGDGGIGGAIGMHCSTASHKAARIDSA